MVTMLKSRNKVIEINTKDIKASQFNHITEQCVKKKLSNRWNEMNGQKVQRDLYSAFLIRCTRQKENSKNFELDVQLCNKEYDNFLKLHNTELERLKLTTRTPAIRNIF